MDIRDKKRIVILGDSGRGKSILAEKLSKNLGLEVLSADNFIWEIKFSKQRDKKNSLDIAINESKKDRWIYEGSSLRLARPFLDNSDLVVYLEHKSFFGQSYVLFKRFLKRDNENIKTFYKLIRHNFYKRYGLGYKKNSQTTLDCLKEEEISYIKLSSFEEIDEFVKSLNN